MWQHALRQSSETLMIDDPLSNRPKQCPPPKLEIVVDGDETTVQSPACPLPHIPLTNNHLWKHVEVEARNILQQRSITKQDILRLFHMLPRSLMLGQAPNQYVVAGANPRCRMNILTLSRNLPFFTHCVNRFINMTAPSHSYTNFVIRQGCVGTPHRDTRNGPFPTAIMSLTKPSPGEGLWFQDNLGRVYKKHNGVDLAGTVVSLDSVFYLNARKILHCGHVPNLQEVSSRVILVAFTNIQVSTLHEWCLNELKTLNFPVPDNLTVHQALHGSIPGEPRRLRQLTLKEAFNCPQELLDQHDVIELLEESQDPSVMVERR